MPRGIQSPYMVEPCVAGYPPLFQGSVKSYIHYNKNIHFFFKKNVKIIENFSKIFKIFMFKNAKILEK